MSPCLPIGAAQCRHHMLHIVLQGLAEAHLAAGRHEAELALYRQRGGIIVMCTRDDRLGFGARKMPVEQGGRRLGHIALVPMGAGNPEAEL